MVSRAIVVSRILLFVAIGNLSLLYLAGDGFGLEKMVDG